MKDGPNIVGIAALIGDHARAEMLTALMADQALTATELAAVAGVTKQTVSAHLAKLVDARLARGRGAGTASLLSPRRPRRGAAARVADGRRVPHRRGARCARARASRRCARRASATTTWPASLGVLVYDSLRAAGAFTPTRRASRCTPRGPTVVRRPRHRCRGRWPATRRPLCRPCLDWSERRHHLAGALGARCWRASSARLGAPRARFARDDVFRRRRAGLARVVRTRRVTPSPSG